MIKLAFFTMNKKVIKFEIDNRIIIYKDDMWPSGVQLMPIDVHLVKEMRFSRKPNLKIMADLIINTNSGKELEEYNACKTDEALAEMVRKDAKSKALMEIA